MNKPFQDEFLFSFQTFKKKPDHFPFFFKCILKAALAETDGEFSLHEQTVLLLFLDHCFNSLVNVTLPFGGTFKFSYS